MIIYRFKLDHALLVISFNYGVLLRIKANTKQRAESTVDSATMSTATRARVRVAVFSCTTSVRKPKLQNYNKFSQALQHGYLFSKRLEKKFILIDLHSNQNWQSANIW